MPAGPVRDQRAFDETITVIDAYLEEKPRYRNT
jgi:hypothetical protein